jgi:hypothetical protein
MLRLMRKHAGIIGIVLCLGYLIVGLWPFNFHAHNRAQVSRDGKGLHFEPLAIATGGDVSLGSSFSIEMMVSVETKAMGNIRSLFSIYNGAFPEDLFAAQWKDEFLMRLPFTDPKGRRRYREIDIESALPEWKPRFLAIVCGIGGTALFVDGQLAKAYPRVVPRLPNLHGELILGDSPNEDRAFTGTLFGFALFNRALSSVEVGHHKLLWDMGKAENLATEPELARLYLFDRIQGSAVKDLSRSARTLVIPEHYRAINRRVLSWQNWTLTIANVQDIVINVLGFVPFGFFYYAWRCHKGGGFISSIAATVLASAIVSVAIELTQVLLPTRSSSMRDLICNILGGALGIIIVAKMPRIARIMAN